MKKINGDVAPLNSNPFADPRAWIRHQSLIQDFRELSKETQTMRRKLEAMKERKAILMAEVRFLRRRYKYLTRDRLAKLPFQTELMLPTNLGTRGRSNGAKCKKQSKKGGGGMATGPRFDSNLERKSYRKEVAPTLLVDSGNEAIEKPISLPDLNQSDRVYNANETTVKRRVPVFDLNQISGEEEKLEANEEQTTRMVDLKTSSCRREGDELPQQIDMKLSVCRSNGSSSNRTGKRKISWQDPVALRV